MRIRYKKWARPELEACEFYEDEPEKWILKMIINNLCWN